MYLVCFVLVLHMWFLSHLGVFFPLHLCLISVLNEAPAGGLPNYYQLGKDHSSTLLCSHA